MLFRTPCVSVDLTTFAVQGVCGALTCDAYDVVVSYAGPTVTFEARADGGLLLGYKMSSATPQTLSLRFVCNNRRVDCHMSYQYTGDVCTVDSAGTAAPTATPTGPTAAPTQEGATPTTPPVVVQYTAVQQFASTGSTAGPCSTALVSVSYSRVNQCYPQSCTYNAGLYFNLVCAPSATPPTDWEATFARLQTYESSTCVGNADAVSYAMPSTCFWSGGDGYSYFACSPTTGTVTIKSCSDAACSVCTETTYEQGTCLTETGGRGVILQCPASATATPAPLSTGAIVGIAVAGVVVLVGVVAAAVLFARKRQNYQNL